MYPTVDEGNRSKIILAAKLAEFLTGVKKHLAADSIRSPCGCMVWTAMSDGLSLVAIML